MARLTDQEKPEVLRFLEADKPLPEKDRSLELPSICQDVAPGHHNMAVKVVDIFRNDTMTIVEVNV